MEPHVSLDRIAEIISLAPGWTRVGITAPDPRMRERATHAFAEFSSDRLDDRRPATDPGQIPLPF